MTSARTRIAALAAVAAAVPCIAGAVARAAAPAAETPLQFTVRYDAAITDTYSGRVYVLGTTGRREPRFGPSWFGDAPFYAVDVENWKPDTPLVLDGAAAAFPRPMNELAAGSYAFQAVMRLNADTRNLGSGPGNAYSTTARLDVQGSGGGNVDLVINQVVDESPFPTAERVQEVILRSDLLSDFHGRDVLMRAAVILPAGYDDDPTVRYPALYWIGGFGSSHRQAGWMVSSWSDADLADRLVRIVLDADCYGGHHVFADSDNNGPRARALVEEFIPHLEKAYRLVAAPTARFLSGHSSGGWSSLWLQITHPDFFGGVWSIAPDPVDFSDFQQIDLYAPGVNMYVDAEGARRPLARRGDQVMLWYEPFVRQEAVLGDGGQIRSFEWAFSPRGPDGRPERLFDRETGAVDAEVAESWKRYDIRLLLEERWPTLGSRLDGKLHVIMGDLDTFYLDGATRRLQATLTRLGSDADIRMLPGEDHSSVMTRLLRKRIDSELLAVFEAHHPEDAHEAVGVGE